MKASTRQAATSGVADGEIRDHCDRSAVADGKNRARSTPESDRVRSGGNHGAGLLVLIYWTVVLVLVLLLASYQLG